MKSNDEHNETLAHKIVNVMLREQQYCYHKNDGSGWVFEARAIELTEAIRDALDEVNHG